MNYESDRLNQLNLEIDQENWQAGALETLGANCNFAKIFDDVGPGQVKATAESEPVGGRRLDETLEAPLLPLAGLANAGLAGALLAPAGYLETDGFTPEARSIAPLWPPHFF